MRVARILGPALLVLGAAALAIALSRGEASLFLIFVFPVITGTGMWMGLGILLVAAGLFFTFLSVSLRWSSEDASPAFPPPPAVPPEGPFPVGPRNRWGGVLFLGPFPIVFGSDQRVTRWMIVAGLLLFLALLVLTLLTLVAI